jgi:hypothetical protein
MMPMPKQMERLLCTQVEARDPDPLPLRFDHYSPFHQIIKHCKLIVPELETSSSLVDGVDKNLAQ